MHEADSQKENGTRGHGRGLETATMSHLKVTKIEPDEGHLTGTLDFCYMSECFISVTSVSMPTSRAHGWHQSD